MESKTNVHSKLIGDFSHVCRLCGVFNKVNKCFYNKYGDIIESVLLYKIQKAFPIIIDYNDRLPKHICKKCETMILLYHENLNKCLDLHQKWYKELNLNGTNKLNDYYKRQNRISNSPTTTDTVLNNVGNKCIIKVESVKELCIDSMKSNKNDNVNMLEERNVNGIGSTEVPKTVKRNKRNYVLIKNVTRKKKRKYANKTPLKDELSDSKLNHLESILDLNDFVEIELIESQFNINHNSKSDELRVNSSTQEKNSLRNPDILTSKKIHFQKIEEPFLKASFKSNCNEDDQYNSNDNSQNILPIQEFQNNCNYSLNVKVECPICQIVCSDIKQLAIHQMTHLSIKLNRINRVLILNPYLRRGSNFTVQGVHRMRCLNCLKRYSNASMLKKHWTLGKCDFYCKICSMSFSSDPKNLPAHFESVHELKYHKNLFRPSIEVAQCNKIKQENDINYPIKIINCVSLNPYTVQKVTPSETKPIRKKIYKRKEVLGKFSCEKCFSSFPNIYSKNSHMRLHKSK